MSPTDQHDQSVALPVCCRVRISRTSRPWCQKPPGNTASAGAHRQVHLAHGEIVEPEGEVRRRIGVGVSCSPEQRDVETDRGAPASACAAIGRLHDAGTAAGRNHVVADAVQRLQAPPVPDDAGELARLLVIADPILRRNFAAAKTSFGPGRLPQATLSLRESGRSQKQMMVERMPSRAG